MAESAEKTRANHGIVFRGTVEASDDVLELISEHADAELIYQRHSAGHIKVVEGET